MLFQSHETAKQVWSQARHNEKKNNVDLKAYAIAKCLKWMLFFFLSFANITSASILELNNTTLVIICQLDSSLLMTDFNLDLKKLRDESISSIFLFIARVYQPKC